MGRNKQTIVDDEIDLREISLTLWKEKYLILIITLIFTVAGYIYSATQPKVYQTTITIRNATETSFETSSFTLLSTLLSPQELSSLASNFNKDFEFYLNSPDHLINFVEQYKKLDEFKSYLKTNNIETKTYFENKFLFQSDEKIKKGLYVLNFYKPLPAVEFLSDYVIFTKQTIENILKKQVVRRIKNKIEIYNQNLEIAKVINLERPILFESGLFISEPQKLFLLGSKVISKKKLYLEEFLKEIEKNDFTLNYNPILKQNLNPTLIAVQPFNNVLIAFALGIFISIIIVFTRSTSLK